MDLRLATMLDSVRGELQQRDDLELRARAGSFLAELDPESQLGLWFDAFARSFASRDLAAIAYVREGATLAK